MIRQERGNALLVGVGGTGKQALTRLASHMCGYSCFQIELSRGYGYDSFHEDLRRLCKMAGGEDRDMVFLFTDTQVGRGKGGAAGDRGGGWFVLVCRCPLLLSVCPVLLIIRIIVLYNPLIYIVLF